MTLVSRSLPARSKIRLLAAMSAALLASAALGQTPPEPPLPLKRVVLYSSGVGFFEHRGEVVDDQEVAFSLKNADINDLLKSLVVQDHGGGIVTSVNYGSPEPIARTLQGFTVDLHKSPSLADMFQQLRGQHVRVQAPSPVEGAIVGVETRSLPSAAGPLSVQVLNLLTDQGLESVRLDAVARTQFLNPRINDEFQQALALLATSRQTDHKRIKLRFQGAGKRRVSAGYIHESPVWKTSYRLVLSDDEAPQIQGWAIVENTTGQPWRNVQLTLVSGRPISFFMDLYEPLYMPRPLVTPERHASLRPRVYEQDLTVNEAAVGGEVAAERVTLPDGSMLGGSFGLGGGMGGMGGGMMGGGMPDGGRRTPRNRSGASAPFVTATPPVEGLDLNQGVASAASGEQLGELFRYDLNSAINLAANESAMLPIVNDTVTGEKLVIYNPAVHQKHPLAGLRLTNTTNIHWMQGPITVFDGGEYAGDARIEDIPPASTRLLSYALDLQTEVALENQPEETHLVGLSIRQGGLHLKQRGVRTIQYVIKNAADRKKSLVLERSIDADWRPVDPKPAETTHSLHRFELALKSQATHRLQLTEHKDFGEQFALLNLKPSQIELYLHEKTASPALKQALEEVIRRKTAIANIEAQRVAIEREIAELAADQFRLRSNLQFVSPLKSEDPFDPTTTTARPARELVERYLTRLDQQESDLEKLRAQLIDLKKEESKRTQELDLHLQQLAIDTD